MRRENGFSPFGCRKESLVINMVRLFKVQMIAALAIAATILAGTPKASAVLVGMTPGGPHTAFTVNSDATPAAGFVNSWTVGSEQAPIPIDYLATNGLWLDELAGSPALTLGQLIQLHEYLKIGDGGPSWVKWTQRFVTEGFNFNSGTLLVDGNLIANGVVTVPGSNTIKFSFDALPAGTVIELTKNIQWMGNANNEFGNVFQGMPNLIQLEQYPTIIRDGTPVVPEPATLSLIGLGLSMAATVGKFRNRKRTIRA